ncbi:hypothetical protein H4R26_002168 [Coemansia thaxteri]|uniref:Uncharacterized protein n=1 Tax=Coemansia thaxteri TaxID=2663907 RepID=A0A9W8EJT0_9FUNG|nr:hypothetical protein H4R26_002168 [Coemansia thaxteri]
MARSVLVLVAAFCLLFGTLQPALAMNITCAGFDTLPKLTYDNVAPQALQQIVIAFNPGISAQILDSYRDALQCRGSTVDQPNYNTLTLTGFTSLQFASALRGSKAIAAVEVDGRVTALPAPSGTASIQRSSRSLSNALETELAGLDSSSHTTSRPGVNSNFGLDASSPSSGSSTSAAASTFRLELPFSLALAAVTLVVAATASVL